MCGLIGSCWGLLWLMCALGIGLELGFGLGWGLLGCGGSRGDSAVAHRMLAHAPILTMGGAGLQQVPKMAL